MASVVLVTTSTGGDVTPGADANVYTRLVPNNTWSEAGLTWNTRPSSFSCDPGSWQFPRGSRSVYDSREYPHSPARMPRLLVYYSSPTATP